MFLLDDLFTPATRQEMVDMLLDIAASLGLPTTSWQPGAVVRTMLVTVAQKLADETQVSVAIGKGGLGDFVTEDQAPLWAKQTFDVDAIEAEPATGTINAANSSVTQYDYDPGEFIVAHNSTGKTYRNQDAISILAGTGLDGIAVSADEVGTGSDAAPGSITVVVTSSPGVTVTNPDAVLGADAETKDQLVLRSRRKLASISPLGPKDAYNYVATSPALSPTSTPITRTKTVANPATGEVTVYLATADGAPTGGDVAIVQTGIDGWAEPWCVTATAVAASENVIDVTYQLWIKGSNLTEAEIKAAVETALAVYLAAAPIGGIVIDPDPGMIYAQELSQVIGTATPGIVLVDMTVPGGDTAIAVNEVPKIGTVTGTVTVL
jgi:hypothetical protein